MTLVRSTKGSARREVTQVHDQRDQRLCMNAFVCLISITKESKEFATFPKTPSVVKVYVILKYFKGVKS